MKLFTTIDMSRYCNAGLENVREDGRWLWRGAARTKFVGAPVGMQEFYGIPFLIGGEKTGRRKQFVVIAQRSSMPDRASATIPIGKRARHVLIAHFCDKYSTRPTRGEAPPDPGELLAEYTFTYTDGSSIMEAVRRRFEIQEYAPMWGQMAFAAWSHIEPIPAAPETPWGHRQTGVGYRLAGSPVTYWIYVWTNPRPGQTIREIQFVATTATPVAIAAITLARCEDHPLKASPRAAIKVDFFGEGKAKPWDVTAEMDLGQVVKTAPLTGVPRDFLSASHKGWGARPVTEPKRSPTYVEAYGTRSASLKIKTSDGESRVRWADVLDKAGAASEDGHVRVEMLHPQKTWMHARVIDSSTGKPTPARVHFSGRHGQYLAPYGHQTDINPNWFEDVGGDLILGRMNYAYVDGEFQIELPVGDVYVEVVKGFEYEPVRKKLNVRPGQRELMLTIEPWVEMNRDGYFSGDTHVHFISTQTGRLEAQAEGVNVTNILAAQWGKLFTSVEEFTGGPSTVSTDDTIIYVNSENRHHMLGHLILLNLKRPVYPLSSGGPGEDHLGGSDETSLAAWCDDCHAQGGLVVAPHFPNPNCELAADIALGKIDAVEIRHFNAAAETYALVEWYRYLNCGYRLPAVGGTDKMVNDMPVGGVRTYAYLGRNRAFTYENWCNAIRRGRSFTSSGPLIDLRVDGHRVGDTIRMNRSGGTVEVFAHAQCAQPFDGIEVVVDGRVVASVSTGKSGKRASVRSRLKIDRSSWIAARCWGKGIVWHGWPVTLYAHTSPVYVYLGRDEIFSPTDATYLLTLVEGGITWADQLAVFRNEEKRLDVLSVFHEAREKLHERFHTHAHGSHHG